MKSLIVALCVLGFLCKAQARTDVWQPSPGHTQMAIWPAGAPDAKPVPGSEFARQSTNLIAGKPVLFVENVSQPTMTVYSPTITNTGVAMVVFPGGGYQILAIDLEGTEICDWLTSKGITAVLLKYRVPVKREGQYGESTPALQDA
jgi:acetyl esterase/lipase